jgi:hypothetical protein
MKSLNLKLKIYLFLKLVNTVKKYKLNDNKNHNDDVQQIFFQKIIFYKFIQHTKFVC